MTTTQRYFFLAIIFLLILHFALLSSYEGYSAVADLGGISKALKWNKTALTPAVPTTATEDVTQERADFLNRRANATLVMLARNNDLLGVVQAMQQVEDRFNKRFNYPWTFLSDQPFKEDFIKWTSTMTDAPTEYGIIGKEHWGQPSWINETRAAETRKAMKEAKIIYGESTPYRNMCRFNSGFFYHHELLQKYKFYWRIEPGVRFYCDLDFDPLLFMQDQRKVYGFTIAIYEYPTTIQSLWSVVSEFIEKNRQLLHEHNAMKFISHDNGKSYNLCHFWSNFEIADMDFWRGEAYSRFFAHLDQSGGFYYERWGDAPIHTIGAALFADRDQLHWFNEIGYRHEPFELCPKGELHTRGKCWCDEKDTYERAWYSCLKHFERLY